MTTDNTETRGVFLTVTERGSIITKTLAHPAGPARDEQLRTLLGGGASRACDQFPSPKTPRREIHFLCDEDGVAKALPFNLGIRGEPIHGPIVVVGADGPAIVGLSDAEAVALSDLFRRIARAHDQMP